MRNTSESPEGNEQAKTTPTRSRSSARSKSESATPGSQEQETKVTRRRTTSASNSDGAVATPNSSGTESKTTPAAPASRSTATQRAGTTTGKTTASPKQRDKEPATTTTTTTSSETTSRPAPAQRASAATSKTTASPTQHDKEHTTTTSSETTPRPAAAQRAAGNSGTITPMQRAGGTTATPAQRTGGPGSPVQQQNRTPTTPAQTQRPGSSSTFVQRAGGTTAQTQRSSGTVAPVQRQPNGAARSTFQGGATVQHPTQPRPANRPGSGNTGAGTSRPGSTIPGRPGAARPGGQGHPGSVRPGGQGHPSRGRPGSRPGAPAQRTQERRVAVVKEKPTGPVAIPPQIVVKDLAELLHTTPNETIRGLIKHGIFASINQVVEYDKAALVAQDLGFEPNPSVAAGGSTVQNNNKGLSANEAMMASRHEDNMVVIPPVVTIMGHVDHGKTSLLDTIRKTKVAAGEAGGITQHIGAYQVEVNGKKITFLDTPGHEAFTAMRARGAHVTHIAIIVVAADDGVMPQTREAIDHARAAKVPIIIALNKIDKANANPDHVKQQLADIGVVIEEYGGDVVCVPVSARRGTGIDELLEMILLVAEVQDIKADPNRPATGTIIEAKLEKNTGPMATVLIQQGTLKMGDNIVVGVLSGKVRAMFNDRGKRIQKAPPSMPVSILGLPEVPNAGDRLAVVPDERTAKQMVQKIVEQRRSESAPPGQVNLDTLYMQMQEGKVKELNVVLKCDVQGSAEAIKNALTKVGEENIKVRLIHEGIGNINETDVHLASASGAVIIGFNVKADGAAQRLAQKEGVDIRYYNVIYKLTDDIQAALTGMLEPTYREVIDGHAEVIQIFKAGKSMIAGCRITDGKIARSAQARILRKDAKVYDGKIASLRRGKDDVREVASGYECGIILEDFTEYEIGDIIEAFSQERVKAGA
jgi:translation initiation factor IF-2